MSLINEALKRAKEAQNQPQEPAPKHKTERKVSEPAMRPVEARPQPNSSAVYVLSAALVVVLLGAVALLWMWSNSQQKSVTQTIPSAQTIVASPAPPQPVAVQVATPVVAPKAPEQPIVPAPTPQAPVVTENVATPTEIATVVTPEPTPAPAPEPVVPAVPQFPTLKLQGIFYNASNPAAVLNGKTYSVGGVVSGARITKIESEKVTVEWNGETRVLETAQ